MLRARHRPERKRHGQAKTYAHRHDRCFNWRKFLPPNPTSCGILASVIDLRRLTPDDWATWRQVRLAALAEAPYAFGSSLAEWQGVNDSEDRWRDRLSLAGSHNVVAMIDNSAVGMVSGVPATRFEGVVELISMWVAPAARGRGVGDALVSDVERWARSIGGRTLRLNVSEGNAFAFELYERHGFACTGEQGDLMPDGVRHEEVMEKQL